MKLYPRGKQLEQIKKLPEKDCCPNLTFDMIDDDEKRYLAELMEATGVTKSPLFKLVKSRVPTAARSLTSINDELLEKMPVWIKDSVFKETKVEDIPFRSTNEPKTFQEKAFFKNEVDMTPEQSWRCAAITVDQSKNNTWRNERSKRPTSTKALALINAYEKFKKNKLDYNKRLCNFSRSLIFKS